MIRVVGRTRPPELATMVEEELSPEELAEFHRRSAAFRRNSEWFAAHANELYEKYVGQFICVAGGEVFAGTQPRDVYAEAAAKYPQEAGAQYGMYIRDLTTRSRPCA